MLPMEFLVLTQHNMYKARMSYELTTEKHKDYLHVTASGTRSFQAVLAIVRDILSACVKEKVNMTLVDLRGLKGHFETLDAYSIPDQYFPKYQYRNVIARCAIIDLKEYENRVKFFENVAVNRGFFLRFFIDSESAVEWLKN